MPKNFYKANIYKNCYTFENFKDILQNLFECNNNKKEKDKNIDLKNDIVIVKDLYYLDNGIIENIYDNAYKPLFLLP